MEDQELLTIVKKKRFLKRYKKTRSRIARLEEKLSVLEERITTIKAPNYSGMPRGGTPVTVEDLILDKTELEKRIAKLKENARDLKHEILEEIDTLEDPRHCEVLESYFIDCLSIEDTADVLGYSVRHVYTLYKEAINLIALK